MNAHGLRRLFGTARQQWSCGLLLAVSLAMNLAAGAAIGEDAVAPSSAVRAVDATTLHNKVLCGYQGWFRCPGDGTSEGWLHWSRAAREITPESLTVEMWPDMTEYSDEERYLAPGFTTPDGQPAYLFSSANRRTVERHFQWMQQYGIDGVFVQRFLVNLEKPSFDTVLEHARSAADQTGRVYAVCYDLTAAPRDQLYEMLVRDWKRLVDELQVTRDERYLHHHGKPVLFIWGFFSDRFDAELAHQIIDFFESDERYSVTLIGGCPWYWRRERNAEWARAYRRFDMISPWNVGNYALGDGEKIAATGTWEEDRDEAARHKMEFLPVIYPGFGWTNLQGPGSERATIARRGGEFYWEQFHAAAELGLNMAYVAMFDEVDEATAIFKVSNAPPTQARFQTYEGLPTDWYLRLTGEGTKLLRGERMLQPALPIRP